MWRHYNEFYYSILKEEIALAYRCGNIHEYNCFEGFFILSAGKRYSSAKEGILRSGGLQLLLNTRGKLVLSKSAKPGANVTRCLGSRARLDEGCGVQFFIYILSSVLGGTNSTSPLDTGEATNVFLLIRSAAQLTRLAPHILKFKRVAPLEALLVLGASLRHSFLFKQLKFPIKNN